VALLLLGGCQSARQVPYLQQAARVSPGELQAQSRPYEERLLPQDLLTISVYTSDPVSASPFNLLVVPATQSVSQGTGQLYSSPAMQTYLVDKEGMITFPVLGRLKIGGLYKREAEALIRGRLTEHLKEEPVITIRLVNYRVSVLGEVARPGTFTVPNEKVNVLEALALAGDMTIYGRRDSVLLVRTNPEGVPGYHYLNLNDPRLVISPYYQLQQGDVVYITPNKSKSRASGIGSGETLAISGVSILLSLINLIFTITR